MAASRLFVKMAPVESSVTCRQEGAFDSFLRSLPVGKQVILPQMNISVLCNLSPELSLGRPFCKKKKRGLDQVTTKVGSSPGVQHGRGGHSGNILGALAAPALQLSLLRRYEAQTETLLGYCYIFHQTFGQRDRWTGREQEHTQQKSEGKSKNQWTTKV